MRKYIKTHSVRSCKTKLMTDQDQHVSSVNRACKQAKVDPNQVLTSPRKLLAGGTIANDRCLITDPSTLPKCLSWSATKEDFDRRGGLSACISDPAQHHTCATSPTTRCCCCSNYITLSSLTLKCTKSVVASEQGIIQESVGCNAQSQQICRQG